MGDYQQARQLQSDTLTRSRRALREDHPVTLRSAHGLGMVLWSLGEYQLALQLQNDILTRSRRVLGEDHPTTLETQVQPSASPWGPWVSIRRPASSRTTPSPASGESSARTIPTRCVQPASSASPWARWASTSRPASSRTTPSPACRRVLGEDHPETLRTASLLGLTLGLLGEHQQARQLQNDTLTRLRRVLGDDHPETLNSASRLAADLRELGEYQQARALDEDTLARRRRVLGEDHPDTLTSAHNLAADLRGAGRARGHVKPSGRPRVDAAVPLRPSWCGGSSARSTRSCVIASWRRARDLPTARGA